jgi:hypothetical protein
MDMATFRADALENMARKSETCPQGHIKDPPGGSCRVCGTIRQRGYRAAK